MPKYFTQEVIPTNAVKQEFAFSVLGINSIGGPYAEKYLVESQKGRNEVHRMMMSCSGARMEVSYNDEKLLGVTNIEDDITAKVAQMDILLNFGIAHIVDTVLLPESHIIEAASKV